MHNCVSVTFNIYIYIYIYIRNHVCVYSYQKKYTNKWIMLEVLACDLTRGNASSKLGTMVT